MLRNLVSNDFGHREINTKANILEIKMQLSDVGSIARAKFRDGVLSNETAACFLKALGTELDRCKKEDKSKRITAWKKKLQAEEKEAYKFVKRKGTQTEKAMRMKDGT